MLMSSASRSTTTSWRRRCASPLPARRRKWCVCGGSSPHRGVLGDILPTASPDQAFSGRMPLACRARRAVQAQLVGLLTGGDDRAVGPNAADHPAFDAAAFLDPACARLLLGLQQRALALPVDGHA